MFIVLSILASTLIFIVFKLLERFKINTSQAIVVNYFSACILGFFSYSKPIRPGHIIMEEWFFGAIALGFLFIVVFNVMAITAQKNGLSVASVATKMSVVIPVLFGILVYKESLNFAIVLGIILALISVYLASSKSDTMSNLKRNLMLPMFLFIGTGLIDTTLKFFQKYYVANDDISVFSATIFGFAALFGIVQLLFKKQFSFDFKTILGGILLGLVNFGSLYYILKSLQMEGWSSATVFTLNNVGIVMLSTLVGRVFFKEKLVLKNWIGIGIAMIAITLITFAE